MDRDADVGIRERVGWRSLAERRAGLLAALAVFALIAGGVAHILGAAAVGDDIWHAAPGCADGDDHLQASGTRL